VIEIAPVEQLHGRVNYLVKYFVAKTSREFGKAARTLGVRAVGTESYRSKSALGTVWQVLPRTVKVPVLMQVYSPTLRIIPMKNTARSLAVLLALVIGCVTQAHAQLVQIDWAGSTGSQGWHTAGNWVGGVIPNTVAPDPSLQIANLSVNLSAPLTVDLGATDARIAQLRLGSKSSAVATTITGSTGRLVFSNSDQEKTSDTADADFNNSTTVDGLDFLIWQRGFGKTGVNLNSSGDANGDQVVDAADLAVWKTQYGIGSGLFNPGSPGIESNGVAGVTNTISAPIHLGTNQLEFGGPRDLTISGVFTYEGDPDNANVSNAGFRSLTAGQTVTITSPLTIVNSDAADVVDFQINNHAEAAGKIVIDGVMSGAGDIFLGRSDPSSAPLGTIVLKNNNTYTGSIRAGRGNLILDNDNALGKSQTINDNGTPGDTSDDFFPMATYRQQGPATTDGYNMISTSDDRKIPNKIIMAQWQTISGEHSIEFTGDISQTNNRGIINMLPAGKTVTFSGDVHIWEDDEALERRFVFDGSGRTILKGTITDDELDTTGRDRRLQKTGSGVLVIDVAAGKNNHSGPELVTMGNLHYANNGSLNASTFTSAEYSANIRATGGAVGVDVHPAGQTLATNTVFLNKIDSTSTGGLMLAASDANVNLDFGSANLTNARNMSLAAPETGITYTGTYTPYNNEYRLGGGSGTLTMPNAQLTGARTVSIRNGGTVKLTGANTYTGATTIESKYTSTSQIPGTTVVLDQLVNPTLEVSTLANGGVNSSIGASSNAAANLFIHASTLKYTGAGSTTDRLFTIGTGGATLDASGTGAVVFSNTGAAVSADAADITGTLDDFAGNPNVIYNASNSRDVIVGMTVSDPDPTNPNTDFTGIPEKCGPNGTNCIPAMTSPTPPEAPKPVVVTGVSNNGKEIGLNANYPFIYKENTRLVFGTVARTLTLSGTNSQANILSPVISNSTKGGVVNIVKKGTGTWLLEGLNTTTGTTTVEAGMLGGNGGVGGALTVNSGATFAPGGTGASAIGDFSVGGSFTLSTGAILAMQLGGTATGSYDFLSVTGAATLSGVLNLSAVSFSPAMGNQFTLLTAAGGISDAGLTISGLTGFTKSIVGNSLVLTKTAALSALTSVPEPSALILMSLAVVVLGSRRK
jgi:autotransporter-associated beta strand protein